MPIYMHGSEYLKKANTKVNLSQYLKQSSKYTARAVLVPPVHKKCFSKLPNHTVLLKKIHLISGHNKNVSSPFFSTKKSVGKKVQQ